MVNFPKDIVEMIIKFVGNPSLPRNLSLQLKQHISYYHYQNNVMSVECLQIIRKTKVLVELVLLPFRNVHFELDMEDISFPYINTWEINFFQLLERLHNEGLCDYKTNINTYRQLETISIGGISMLLDLRSE